MLAAATELELAGWTLTLIDIGPMAIKTGPPLPANVLLARRGDETVLVDCGPGVLRDRPPLLVKYRDLGSVLTSAGSPPETVSLVVVSHLDYDHIGGLVVGRFPESLAPAFPNARVAMLAPALAAAHSGDLDGHENGSDEIVAALEASQLRVDGLEDGAEMTPGVSLRSAPGHRTGHAVVQFSDGGERFLYLADAFHFATELAEPGLPFSADAQPEVAIATRQALIVEMEEIDAFAATHMPGFWRHEPSSSPRFGNVGGPLT